MNKPKKELDLDFSATEKVELALLNSHVHFLTGDIEEENIEKAIKWIVYENLNLEPNKVLTLYVNSDGGYLSDAFALIDIMINSKIPVRTIGIGTIASAAFLIFASGTKGQRYIAKNTSIMCHQFSGSNEGKYHDIKAQMRESELSNQRMIDLLKNSTNLDTKTIKNKLLPPSDVFLTPEELVQYGVADHFLN